MEVFELQPQLPPDFFVFVGVRAVVGSMDGVFAAGADNSAEAGGGVIGKFQNSGRLTNAAEEMQLNPTRRPTVKLRSWLSGFRVWR